LTREANAGSDRDAPDDPSPDVDWDSDREFADESADGIEEAVFEQPLSITQQLDPDELVAGWKAMDALRPELHVVVSIGAKTDLGCIRENNEDKYDLLEPREPGVLACKGRLYGVADGMGGHSAGQIASELALKTLIRAYYSEPTQDTVEALREGVSAANIAVYEDSQVLPERAGMGTTLTAVVIREDRLYVVHVGDSRAYLIRDDTIRQISQDHSWVAEQVKLGGMTLDEALASPFRNIILRSIGTGPVVEADFYSEDLRVGDVVLLCSDGLTTHLDDVEIAENLASDLVAQIGPSVAASRLVEIANDRGGRDNVTVLLILVESIGPYSGP
jgi:protein phosphatase